MMSQLHVCNDVSRMYSEVEAKILIDPVPLFYHIIITLLVSVTTIKWAGLFHTIFYILSRTRPLLW